MTIWRSERGRGPGRDGGELRCQGNRGVLQPFYLLPSHRIADASYTNMGNRQQHTIRLGGSIGLRQTLLKKTKRIVFYHQTRTCHAACVLAKLKRSRENLHLSFGTATAPVVAVRNACSTRASVCGCVCVCAYNTYIRTSKEKLGGGAREKTEVGTHTQHTQRRNIARAKNRALLPTNLTLAKPPPLPKQKARRAIKDRMARTKFPSAGSHLFSRRLPRYSPPRAGSSTATNRCQLACCTAAAGGAEGMVSHTSRAPA